VPSLAILIAGSLGCSAPAKREFRPVESVEQAVEELKRMHPEPLRKGETGPELHVRLAPTPLSPSELEAARTARHRLEASAASARETIPERTPADNARLLWDESRWPDGWDGLLVRGRAAAAALRKAAQGRGGLGRVRAGALLHLLGDAQGVPVLLGCLEDPSRPVRSAADAALQGIAGESVEFDPKDADATAWQDWRGLHQADITRQLTARPLRRAVRAAKEGFILIEAGRNDRVRVGDEFDLYRGGRYIARTRVLQVGAEVCFARVVIVKAAPRAHDVAVRSRPDERKK